MNNNKFVHMGNIPMFKKKGIFCLILREPVTHEEREEMCEWLEDNTEGGEGNYNSSVFSFASPEEMSLFLLRFG